jgi:hypothetical protein
MTRGTRPESRAPCRIPLISIGHHGPMLPFVRATRHRPKRMNCGGSSSEGDDFSPGPVLGIETHRRNEKRGGGTMDNPMRGTTLRRLRTGIRRMVPGHRRSGLLQTVVAQARRALDDSAARALSPHARRERRRALRAARIAAWRAQRVGLTGAAGDRQVQFWLRRSGRSLEASLRKPPHQRRNRALKALVVVGAAGAGTRTATRRTDRAG